LPVASCAIKITDKTLNLMNHPPIQATPVRKTAIAVIGEANTARSPATEQAAEELGCKLIDAGFRIVTGGLGGVMEAACRGAHLSTRYEPGDTIGILPGNDSAAANPYVDVAIPTGLDFARNSIVPQSDAVIALGGGAGTLSEICFAWMYKRLIIVLGKDGWAGRLAGQRLDERIRYNDLPEDKIYPAETPDDAVKLLVRLLPAYSKKGRLSKVSSAAVDPS
jgi:uncharacterized protein (TIGR00725 family)